MRRTPITLMASLLIGLVACGGGPTGSSELSRVLVASGDLILPIGGTAPLTAVAFDAGGAPVAASISWRSTSPAVASVSGGGLVTGVALGTARIIASAGGRADTITVEVRSDTPVPVVIEAVAVARDSLLLAVGATDSLAALAVGPGGSAVTTPITWQSTESAVASVNPSGRVVGVTPGVALIIASVANKADTVRVTVHGPLFRILVDIDRTVIKSSDTTRVRARGEDGGGRRVPITPEWQSGDTTIALVTPNGLVFGLAYNSNTILTATVDGIVGFTFVSVIPSEVKSIRILPVADTIGLGVAITMQAEVLDEFDVVVTDRPVTWSSSNPDVVSVHPTTGAIFAISPGTATIRATVEGFTATESFVVLPIPQNVYLLDVTNQLLASVRIFVNDSLIITLPERSTGSIALPKVPSIQVRWQLIRPKAETAGEPLIETFPVVMAPTGAVKVTIDNVVNGKTYFTPLLRSLVPGKFDVEMTVRDVAGPCGCSVSSEEEDRRLGYWPLRTGASVMIINSANPAQFITIPVPAQEVEAGSGIWRTTVLVAP